MTAHERDIQRNYAMNTNTAEMIQCELGFEPLSVKISQTVNNTMEKVVFVF